MSIEEESKDPITDASAEIVKHDGSIADLRKQLQSLSAALAERKKYKKNTVKQIQDQIDETQEMIDDIVQQLEGLEKTL
jgi:hypothetical protein